jgi:type I site-specific restriction endonuclease
MAKHQPQRNEAQVRFELIDPALEDRGWNRRTDIRVEETAKPVDIVNHQPRKRPTGRPDYVLRRPLTPGSEFSPLAILYQFSLTIGTMSQGIAFA